MSKAKDIIAELSEKHCVLMLSGKAHIFSWEPSPLGRRPAFSTPAAMRVLYAKTFITLNVPDGNGGFVPQRRAAFDVWLKSQDRPTAFGVVIDPKGGRFVDGALNLWQGFAVEPIKGDWSLIRAHIEQVVCDGNRELSRYLLRWLAWVLQHPTEPAEVVVVMRGVEGAGKGIIARLMASIFGKAHAIQISDRRHLTGNFNSHLMNCLFLFADEAVWGGDKASEGALKRLISEPTLLIEPKGVDAFEVPNMLSIMMASNEQWAVPVGEEARRYVVADVSDEHAKDFEYFRALTQQIANGGAEAFLYAMLNADLEGWHPRENIPDTQALRDQKAETAHPSVHWLGSILAEGALPFAVRDESGSLKQIVHDDDPALARSLLLWKQAKASDHQLRFWKETQFWAFLKDHHIVTDEGARTKRGRYRRFPPLLEARRIFRERHPWWPEFDDDQRDWRFGERPKRAAFSERFEAEVD